MLSREVLDSYRRMSPGERCALTLQSMRENWPYLFHGTKELVDRRFLLLKRENDARNQGILDGESRLKPSP
jgi:hypothetical protein